MDDHILGYFAAIFLGALLTGAVLLLAAVP